MKQKVNVYFSDFFNVEQKTLEEYVAFDISLINDIPLFIDPFLLFNSEKKEYRDEHENILKYLMFLKEKSSERQLDKGLINAWYRFPELKQNWFGYSKEGNGGRGLGNDFAQSLHENLHHIFHNFGDEGVTKSSHLEKLCLISGKVGRDSISDFTARLLHKFLLDFTQKFALEHIDRKFLRKTPVSRSWFNYSTESWATAEYTLPIYNGDYILLTPIDILTKDNTRIYRADVNSQFHYITDTIENQQLKAQVNNYFWEKINEKSTKEERSKVITQILQQFPEFIDYYIRFKEVHGDQAVKLSFEKVSESRKLFVDNAKIFISTLYDKTDFYKSEARAYDEAMKKVQYLKHVIEDCDGYKIFYINNEPLQRESDLQVLFKLTWEGSTYDANFEVNNGRGPADTVVSKGKLNKSIVEFKLAKNTQLERNLKNQTSIYEKASQADRSIKVILYFDVAQLARAEKILKKLGMYDSEDIVLIDARRDNKPSASTA